MLSTLSDAQSPRFHLAMADPVLNDLDIFVRLTMHNDSFQCDET